MYAFMVNVRTWTQTLKPYNHKLVNIQQYNQKKSFYSTIQPQSTLFDDESVLYWSVFNTQTRNKSFYKHCIITK